MPHDKPFCYACKKDFNAVSSDVYTIVTTVLPISMPDVYVCPSCQRLFVINGLMLLSELYSRRNK
jgi:hypothetical protein